MDIAQNMDSDALNNIIKKSLGGIVSKEKTETLTEKSIVKVSNSVTSLQNAFNNIYAYTLNVKNIHKLEEKRLQNIKKEVTMETKTSTATFAGGSDIEVGNLPDIFKQLTKSVEALTKNLNNLDMSASGGTISDIDIDGSSKKRRGGSRAKIGGRALGLIGAAFDITARAGEGQSAAQMAVGVGSGVVGSFAGAQLGSAVGFLGGPIGRVAGSLIGSTLGYMGGSALGDKIYNVATNKTSSKRLESAASDVINKQAKLEKAPPPGSTSFSSRFADYINQSISNMAQWSMAASPLLAGAFAGAGMLGNMLNEYVSPEGAGSTANAETAMQYFVSQGWTKAQAAGIVGNLQGESGPNLNPNAFRANDAGTGLHSYGIAQWNRGRWSGLQAYAQRIGKPWNELQTQLQYVQRELITTESAVGEDLKGAQDAGSAAVIMSRYERYSGYRLGLASPETRKRIANANTLLTGGAADTSKGGQGKISSGYGMRVHPTLGVQKMHTGVDIKANTGTPVYAVQSGTVTFAGFKGANGNLVKIAHGGNDQSAYAHLNRILVPAGRFVKKGALIGEVGSSGRSTGPHLHFEFLKNGTRVDPRGLYENNKWIVGGEKAADIVPEPAKPKPPAPPSSPTLGQRLDNVIDIGRSFFTGDPPPAPAKSSGVTFADPQKRR